MGMTKVRNFSGGSPGLLTLPSYIGDNTLSYFYLECIGAAISIVVSFAISFLLYKEPVTEEDALADKDRPAVSSNDKDEAIQTTVSGAEETVVSPMKGEAVALSVL
ncbi:hypothetical protein [Carnobacterium mobile]|uniref:hypothetical protein n=1 Tax=Carnobacterium mobile TaxID=2750 RepID=UPI0018673F5E|nr:hypothetical protein [Carnobacterium mobile]